MNIKKIFGFLMILCGLATSFIYLADITVLSGLIFETSTTSWSKFIYVATLQLGLLSASVFLLVMGLRLLFSGTRFQEFIRSRKFKTSLLCACLLLTTYGLVPILLRYPRELASGRENEQRREARKQEETLRFDSIMKSILAGTAIPDDCKQIDPGTGYAINAVRQTTCYATAAVKFRNKNSCEQMFNLPNFRDNSSKLSIINACKRVIEVPSNQLNSDVCSLFKSQALKQATRETYDTWNECEEFMRYVRPEVFSLSNFSSSPDFKHGEISVIFKSSIEKSMAESIIEQLGYKVKTDLWSIRAFLVAVPVDTEKQAIERFQREIMFVEHADYNYVKEMFPR